MSSERIDLRVRPQVVDARAETSADEGAIVVPSTDEHRSRPRRRIRSAAIGTAFAVCAVAQAPAVAAAPAASQARTASGGVPSGRLLVSADDGRSDADKAQRAAAELAVSSAMANNPPAPAHASTYVQAGGMGELAVVMGQATTSSTSAPHEAPGITLAPMLEADAPTQLVDYDGHRFSYSSIQNRRAEIVGSTSVGQEQQIIIMRNAEAPTTYTFRLSREQVDAGASMRRSAAVPGGAEVVSTSGAVIAHISRPWARSATGAAVPTSISVERWKLVQRISTADLPPPPSR